MGQPRLERDKGYRGKKRATLNDYCRKHDESVAAAA
jgi:hypothetical protein